MMYCSARQETRQSSKAYAKPTDDVHEHDGDTVVARGQAGDTVGAAGCPAHDMLQHMAWEHLRG